MSSDIQGKDRDRLRTKTKTRCARDTNGSKDQLKEMEGEEVNDTYGALLCGYGNVL